MVRGLKAQGVSFIYISHHLDEIFQIADRVTVFKDGRKVAERPTAGTTKDQLVSLMVGRDLGDRFPAKRGAAGEVVLEVEGLKGPGFRDASLQLRRGEVLGSPAWSAPAAPSLHACCAARPRRRPARSASRARRSACASPATRFPAASLTSPRIGATACSCRCRCARTSPSPRRTPWARRGSSSRRGSGRVAGAYVERLSVRTPSLEQRIQLLSGGNQQKCILARWLVRGVDILIFDEPTRGIDVGAKSEIYRLIDDFARAGNAVILISSELTEVLGMADRILVMCEGRITGEIPCAEADEARVLALALPHSKSANGTNTASGKLS